MAVYIDGQRRDQQLNNIHPAQDEENQHLNLDRVGYDADTQEYTYRDSATGQYYQGASGNRYGGVEPITQPPAPALASQAPRPRWSEYPPPRSSPSRDRYPAWRYLAPFAMIILVALFLLFRYVGSSSVDDGPAMGKPPKALECPEGYKAYAIRKGDTCWDVAEAHGRSVDELKSANVALDCDGLIPGKQLCA